MNKTLLHIFNFLVLIGLLFFNGMVFWASADLSEGGLVLREWIYLISPFVIWTMLYLVQLTRPSNNQKWLIFVIMVVILFIWQAFASYFLRIIGLY